MLFVTISRTAAIVMAGAAALLALTALYLFFAKPDLTYSADVDVEVTCASVVSGGLFDPSTIGGASFEVVGGDLHAIDLSIAQIDDDCDRRRTAYTAGTALLLAPAVALIVLSLFPWKVSRDESPPVETDSTASEQM